MVRDNAMQLGAIAHTGKINTISIAALRPSHQSSVVPAQSKNAQAK
jgi:hypothetical protein